MHIRTIYRPFHARQVIKAFVAFRRFRAFVCRNLSVNTRRQRQRIHHHPFCSTGMHIVADNFDINRSGVEVFKLQLTYATTVNSVGPLRIECRNVKMLGPFTNLFIRREGHADITVRNVILNKHGQRGHDFRHTCFVIRAQQGFTVCSN